MAMLAAAAPYLMAAGAAVSAYSSVQQGQAMAKAANYDAEVQNANAQIMAQNAKAATDAAASQESADKYNANLILGTQRTAAAAAGIDPNEGSPLQLMTNTAMQTTLTALNDRYQGQMNARAYETQGMNATASSALDRFNAGNYQTGGYVNAGARLLNGAAMYGMYNARYGAGAPYYGNPNVG